MTGKSSAFAQALKALISRIKAALPRIWKWTLKVLTRRLWLKLISLVLAVILWTYIVMNVSSLTRTKTIENLSVTVPASSTLPSQLAVSTDIAGIYQKSIDVTVSVPQNEYSKLTSRNIRITPDYSSIRSAGEYDVPLTAVSTYGEVVRLSPASISVTVESLDSRVFTPQMEIINRDTGTYWYSEDTAALSPIQINVSGPSSVVQSVAGITVTVDAARYSPAVNRQSFTLNLRDQNGETIKSNLIKITNSNGYNVSTCLVRLDVYPKKALDVYVDPAQISLAEGYRIESIVCEPASVTVAADKELLDELTRLSLVLPDDANGISAMYTKRVPLTGLDDYKYTSTSSVTVTVNVSAAEASESSEAGESDE
ncbi:MAG: hypothetical protein IKR85_06750 [Clostridia bacterium]|nr:hypothetical protein [Clostridia bacterium]